MPAAVKTPHDEHDWAKAKSIVDKEYGRGEGESYYRKVMGIYMKMHGRKPGHTSVTHKSERTSAETHNMLYRTAEAHGYKQGPSLKIKTKNENPKFIHTYDHPQSGHKLSIHSKNQHASWDWNDGHTTGESPEELHRHLKKMHGVLENGVRNGQLWLETLSKSDLKDLHIKHRESMRRKIGAANKILEHHGFKPGLNPKWKISQPSTEKTSDTAPKSTFEEHSENYHHPKSGSTVNIRAQKPYTYNKPGTNQALKEKRHGLDWMHVHGKNLNSSGDRPKWLGHKDKVFHHLDSHLSETHGTEPYSRKLRRSLYKSLIDCNLCGGTGILRIAFKSLDNEEKSLRICPICKPF